MLRDRTLLFVHLPKTGGTSVADLLGTRFAPQETLPLRALPAEQCDAGLVEPDRYRFVHGHVPFAVRDTFRTPPFVLTILRDPVDRSVSAYHYLIQTAAADPLHATRTAAADFASRHSLAEFARSEFGARHSGDRQVALLSQPYHPGHFGRHGRNTHVPTRDDLDRATANLEACDVVGLTERLQDTVDLLSWSLGEPSLGTVGTANATLQRATLDELDDDTLAVLHERAALDIELYRFAIDLFEERRRSARRVDVPAGMRGPAPSECRFDAAIPGDGWYTPERNGDQWYSWTGPHATSWIELSSPADIDDAATLEIDVVHTVLHDPFDGFVVQVNDHVCEWSVVPGSTPTRLAAAVPRHVLRSVGEANRVALTVRATARPCDVWPTNADSRVLGMAVARVALIG